ncbi:hypothetical protein R1flu_015032 [Riccia fluitans]|uniref:Uncharacterized protein n=1 Tax=Riccia fluitans TaxID=41844 RepID=A0ABD1YHS3_9MARC
MPRFSGGGGAGEASDEVKLMDDNGESQPSCSESIADDREEDQISEMSANECSTSRSFQSLANMRSAALAINIKASKKVVAEETPAPCSSPSSCFLQSSEAWSHDDVQEISSNSVLNKRKLADKLNILALAREKSISADDSSEEDDADAQEAFDTLCFLQTNKRGKSTASDSKGISNRFMNVVIGIHDFRSSKRLEMIVLTPFKFPRAEHPTDTGPERNSQQQQLQPPGITIRVANTM